jgi:hypothetical protein
VFPHGHVDCVLMVVPVVCRLLQGQNDTSSMHQLACYLQQQGMQYFPDLKEAKFAEFWAHSRRHSSGGCCVSAH